jgi:hypothetical protein
MILGLTWLVGDGYTTNECLPYLFILIRIQHHKIWHGLAKN